MELFWDAVRFVFNIYSLAWSTMALIASLSDFKGQPSDMDDAVDRAFTVVLCVFLILYFLMRGMGSTIASFVAFCAVFVLLAKRVIWNPLGRKGCGTGFWAVFSAGSIPVVFNIGLILSTMI